MTYVWKRRRRLGFIAEQLLEHGKFNLAENLAAFGVSVRTAQRDMDILEKLVPGGIVYCAHAKAFLVGPNRQNLKIFQMLPIPPVSAIAKVAARPIAQGSPDREGLLAVALRFDEDTFAQIRAHALRADLSFSHAVRELVEWELEISVADEVAVAFGERRRA